MAQTGAKEILMGCENFTDLVVGEWNDMWTFCWAMRKILTQNLWKWNFYKYHNDHLNKVGYFSWHIPQAVCRHGLKLHRFNIFQCKIKVLFIFSSKNIWHRHWYVHLLTSPLRFWLICCYLPPPPCCESVELYKVMAWSLPHKLITPL